MGVFFEVVLPIISIFVIGFVVQKWRKLDVKTASTLTIYVFIPFLVFQAFYDKEFSGDFSMIVMFCFILLFSIILLDKILAKILKWDRGEESGIILSTAFMNAGNYGAPVVLFALGQEAFTYAVIFFSIQAIIMNIFGVYYASRGGYEIRYAFYSVLKMPATYAIILAFSLNGLNVQLGGPVIEMIDFMAAVGLPLMMVVLGMQLANIEFKEFEISKVAIGSAIKLLAMPLVAWLFVWLLPVSPLIGKVIIILSAMPTAATTTMFALEFKARPDLVSSVTMVTTLLSVVTNSVLLAILV
ncbi:AEC family transporter [Filobacillus milosensis]|uniref:AEC family transporter n=1 Tax=Filobacillus milosensis TaxID=94137 RepID=A0A4Y8ITP0_9BACI|nr:AEC family transporter [Filobacillus milosensis]TFB24432.1 AEC family transporter [Filobacillus milosensis]